jgi:hypothetical protein
LEDAHVATAAIDDEARDRGLALHRDEAERGPAVDRILELNRREPAGLGFPWRWA